MNRVVNELAIQKIIEKTGELMKLFHDPFQIQLINDSNNKVFKVKGNIEVIAKVGLAGWGKDEFRTLKKLLLKGYNVPKPITFISFQKELDDDLYFGNLDREVGILFYFPLKGENLEQHLTYINIRNALNFLKKLHKDKSLINGNIKKYQQVEVKRGLHYVQKLLKGELAEKIQEVMKEYQDLEISSCFIHGGPRLEHFIIKDGQMGMIDFEGACIGDPFKDLGIFFTELLFYKVNKEELIKNYFNRNLGKEEKKRLQFFELRALLVKKKFDPSKNILDYIRMLINKL
ncbi:MAG: phosphotransferase family protein [Promethearchaeota archaeon]